MRKIAIVSQKGGVGKTTTVLNLGAALAKLGKRVLMVDMDPQAHLTTSSGIKAERVRFSIHEVLRAEIPIQRIIEGISMRLSLVPSHPSLSELEIKELEDTELLLKNSFRYLGRIYDYILIDCPSSLGTLTINALNFVNEVFIVIQTEYLSLKSLPPVSKLIEKVKKKSNNRLKLTGVAATLYDQRRNMDKKVRQKIKRYFKDRMFNSVIRKNVKLAESMEKAEDIFKYSPKCYGARDYLSLGKEVINMEVYP